MSLKLKDPKTLPKDGFVYTQPETGKRIGGLFSFGYVVAEIVAHRMGNNLPRATKSEASADLEQATIQRLPYLAYDPGHIVESPTRQVAGCSTCGIRTA